MANNAGSFGDLLRRQLAPADWKSCARKDAGLVCLPRPISTSLRHCNVSLRRVAVRTRARSAQLALASCGWKWDSRNFTNFVRKAETNVWPYHQASAYMAPEREDARNRFWLLRRSLRPYHHESCCYSATWQAPTLSCMPWTSRTLALPTLAASDPLIY